MSPPEEAGVERVAGESGGGWEGVRSSARTSRKDSARDEGEDSAEESLGTYATIEKAPRRKRSAV